MHGSLLELKAGNPKGQKLPPAELLQVSIDKVPTNNGLTSSDETAVSKSKNTAVKLSQPQAIVPSVPQELSPYYLSREVDIRAEPLKMQALVYPEQAFQLRQYGVVKLRVFINEDGGIDAVDVIESSPPGVFESAALNAMLSSKFVPAEKDGRKVKNQKLIEIKFDPYENIAGLPQGNND